jgi:hypothetical protein
MTQTVRSPVFGPGEALAAVGLRPVSDPARDGAEQSVHVLTDQQAVHWLSEQPGGQIEATMTQLAATLGWSRPTLGRRVDQGLIARRPGKGRTSIFSVGSAVGATVVATISPNATVGVSVDATIPRDPTTIAPLPAISPPPERPPASPTQAITVAAFVAALALAVVSGGFSIVGLTSIFAGAFWPIIGMGVGFEGGKLAAVAWLGHHGSYTSRPLACALVLLVTAMVVLNVIGAYGFLSQAHIQHALAGDLEVAGQAAETDARIAVQTTVVADLDRRVGQIDGAIETATQRGRSNTAMNLADQQRKNRADLVAARLLESKGLAALQVEKARIDGERRKVESDLGPVRYISALIGIPAETVMRWFILAVAFILDPAAVVLLLAASRPDPLAVRRHTIVELGLLKGSV